MHFDTINDLGAFIKQSPTPFHAVDTMRKLLIQEGFEELLESRRWFMAPGKKYFVTRNNSSLIAFKVGKKILNYSFHVSCSHCDSPTFKLKEHAEMNVQGHYTVLNTEGYGGMICSSWFDRPLSIAGRAIVKQGDSYEMKLVTFDEDLCVIPNLAIHMNRQMNEGVAYNKQIDMLPLISGQTEKDGSIKERVAQLLGVSVEDIMGTELSLYNRMAPTVWGADKEFFSCPQLDDLECVYASLQAFLKGSHEKNVNVFACFDNEEVGSCTKQGAQSTFLYDVLYRINSGLGKGDSDYYAALASGFMVSCDNAHAVHPNHPEKADRTNATYMNEGVVIKTHASQKYTSDAMSSAIFRGFCEKAGVPFQYFYNRSDMAGGSTLGNLAMTQVSMNAVDIGLAQLSMHSCYETAGVLDVDYMIRALTEFFNSHIEQIGASAYRVD